LFRSAYGRRECPHCKHQVETTSVQGSVNVSENSRRENFQRQMWTRLYGCTGCGWWTENSEYFDPNRGGAPFVYEVGTLAILRKFDAEDPALPLSALTLALRKRPKILYDLRSEKFEQLVGALVNMPESKQRLLDVPEIAAWMWFYSTVTDQSLFKLSDECILRLQRESALYASF
jgi:hypothetical protein